MKARKLVAAVLLVLTFASACSSPPDLPDRADPQVKAEEARVAKVLGADRSINDEPSVCKVRLLGQQRGASFVWALCTAIGPIGRPAIEHAESSVPLRVDGSKVTQGGDGIGSSCPGLYKIFPKDLADLVCEDRYNGDELFSAKS
jgi:hypothetical protein